ncbi:MAG: Lrp/AsnC family transcriptional regulator [Candidatus Dormibacteria bacterium]
MTTDLDRTDIRLLEALRDDGRATISALAAAAGLSRASVYARVEKLRASGVVTGFTATVDPEKLGLALAALIQVSVRQADWKKFQAQVAEMPEVEYCALTTGGFDALLLVRVRDVEALRDVVLERLQSLPMISSTHTIFVFDEVIRRPFLLPP